MLGKEMNPLSSKLHTAMFYIIATFVLILQAKFRKNQGLSLRNQQLSA